MINILLLILYFNYLIKQYFRLGLLVNIIILEKCLYFRFIWSGFLILFVLKKLAISCFLLKFNLFLLLIYLEFLKRNLVVFIVLLFFSYIKVLLRFFHLFPIFIFLMQNIFFGKYIYMYK